MSPPDSLEEAPSFSRNPIFHPKSDLWAIHGIEKALQVVFPLPAEWP